MHCTISLLTFIVHCTYIGAHVSNRPPADMERTSAQFQGHRMVKSFEEMQSYGKDQVEVATSANSAFSKSLQAMATETADYSKKSMEAATAAFEKIITSKSVEAAFQAQTEYAKSAYESFVAQSTKMGELCTSLAKEAFKPLESAVAKAQAVAK